ncbi:MAG: hypothetical protein U1F37_20460 [Alphaproteobacteria bacterium]
MAINKTVFDANVSLLSTNAGPAPLAGEICNPLFVSSSFMNDQNAEATGQLASKDGVKSVFMLAPNFQAGKDNLAGFQRTYTGKIAGSVLYKLGESDFQADFSKVRARARRRVRVRARLADGHLVPEAMAGLGPRQDDQALHALRRRLRDAARDRRRRSAR